MDTAANSELIKFYRIEAMALGGHWADQRTAAPFRASVRSDAKSYQSDSTRLTGEPTSAGKTVRLRLSQWKTTIFSSVISSMAYGGPSLPKPLSFNPPYGIMSARNCVPELMFKLPASASRAKRMA